MRTAGHSAAVITVLSCLSGCAASIRVPPIPDAVKAPETETANLVVWAAGTQNYTCSAQEGGPAAWSLVAPEATLYNQPPSASATEVGKHSKGPTWEYVDGSKFVGDAAHARKVDAPDSASIPWLLVPRRSVEGSGAISAATFVQRLNTRGGKAPSSGCDSSSVGTQVKVPYTAQYYFYRTR